MKEQVLLITKENDLPLVLELEGVVDGNLQIEPLPIDFGTIMNSEPVGMTVCVSKKNTHARDVIVEDVSSSDEWLLASNLQVDENSSYVNLAATIPDKAGSYCGSLRLKLSSCPDVVDVPVELHVPGPCRITPPELVCLSNGEQRDSSPQYLRLRKGTGGAFGVESVVLPDKSANAVITPTEDGYLVRINGLHCDASRLSKGVRIYVRFTENDKQSEIIVPIRTVGVGPHPVLGSDQIQQD